MNEKIEIGGEVITAHSGGVGANKSIEASERLAYRLGKIHECWDRRFVPEQAVLWESYVNGDFEIVLQLQITFGHRSSIKRHVLASIKPVGAVFDRAFNRRLCNRRNVDVNHGNMGDQGIVFVDFVELGEGPQREIPVSVRLYDVLEEFGRLSLWEGLLYRSQSGALARFQVLPFFMERERHEFLVHNDSGGGEVQGGSEVVDCIANDKRKEASNIDGWLVNELSGYKIRIGADVEIYKATVKGAPIQPSDRIELTGQGRGKGLQVLDVLLGPLNL